MLAIEAWASKGEGANVGSQNEHMLGNKSCAKSRAPSVSNYFPWQWCPRRLSDNTQSCFCVR